MLPDRSQVYVFYARENNKRLLKHLRHQSNLMNEVVILIQIMTTYSFLLYGYFKWL